MIQELRNLKNAFDTTSEISKAIKIFTKTGSIVQKIKRTPWSWISWLQNTVSNQMDCRWWFSAECYWHWNVLQELWDDECLETKLEPDIKGRIIGVKHQMRTFGYFYGVNLGGMLLKHRHNLSRAIKTLHMPAAECQLLVTLATKTLTKFLTEDIFSLFWERCKKAATELRTNKPVLPRKRQCPIRYFLGEVPSEFHDNVKHYYWQIYFESLLWTASNHVLKERLC